jgi:hypothetical protein
MKGERKRRGRTASFTLLVAVLSLAAFLFLERLVTLETPPQPESNVGTGDALQFDRFSARVERDDEGERLSVSLRLRTTAKEGLPCYTFVVARNDTASPRLWSIWPPQPAGPVITAGGHFHGTDPAAGFSLTLTDAWQRITATVSSPSGAQTFDTVVVYVLNPRGKVLLARPFRV